MVKDKLSYRYAFKNHTKKTVKAIRTDVKKAGPIHGYFVSPHSVVLQSSALISLPFPQRFISLLRMHNYPKREFPPFRVLSCSYYTTKKYMIRQMKITLTSAPEKMTPSNRYFLLKNLIQTVLLLGRAFAKRPNVRQQPIHFRRGQGCTPRRHQG